MLEVQEDEEKWLSYDISDCVDEHSSHDSLLAVFIILGIVLMALVFLSLCTALFACFTERGGESLKISWQVVVYTLLFRILIDLIMFLVNKVKQIKSTTTKQQEESPW